MRVWLGNDNNFNFLTCKYRQKMRKLPPSVRKLGSRQIQRQFMNSWSALLPCFLTPFLVSPLPPTASSTDPDSSDRCPGVGDPEWASTSPSTGLSGVNRDAGQGAPSWVTCPGAARQAASPWDNFQRQHARHGKVQSSEPKNRDSLPLCSIQHTSPVPHISENPAVHSPPQPQETPLWCLMLPRPVSSLGLKSPGFLPGPVPVPSPPPQALQDWDPRPQ